MHKNQFSLNILPNKAIILDYFPEYNKKLKRYVIVGTI